MKKKGARLFSITASLMPFAAYAGFNIGTTGNAGFDTIVSWLQDFVNFMDGPGGLAMVIVSVVVAAATWMFIPREGVFGPVFRTVVGAIVIINVGTWISTFTFTSSA